MTEKERHEVKRILQYEKIRVTLYPIIIGSFLYGSWLVMFPHILGTYRVYTLISHLTTHWQVGSVFVLLSVLMFLFFMMRNRQALLLTTILLQMIWTMFTVAFLLSPPPNTVWIFAGMMSYMTFTLCRRV